MPISPQRRCPRQSETYEPTKSQNQITSLKSNHKTHQNHITPTKISHTCQTTITQTHEINPNSHLSNNQTKKSTQTHEIMNKDDPPPPTKSTQPTKIDQQSKKEKEETQTKTERQREKIEKEKHSARERK